MKVAEGLNTSQRVCVSHKWSVQVEEGLCGKGRSKKEGKNKGKRHKRKGHWNRKLKKGNRN